MAQAVPGADVAPSPPYGAVQQLPRHRFQDDVALCENHQIDFAAGQITRCCAHPLRCHIISDFQKLSLTPDPNQLLIARHPVPREGTLAIVTDVGTGSDGRGCAFDERRVKRTAKSCGPGVQHYFLLPRNPTNPCETGAFVFLAKTRKRPPRSAGPNRP